MAEADSEPEAQPQRPEPVPGLTNARAQSLDRTPIRTRGSGVTLSGWRLSAVSDQGEGTIVVVDSESGENWYRGDGIFLGWGAEKLRAAYDALRPESEKAFEIHQLG